MALHATVARSEVTFVDTIDINNNVNNNTMVFSAHDCVLKELLRQ